MFIVLIHGFYKNKHDMSFLEKRLKALGHKTFTTNLPTTFETFESALQTLTLQLKPYEKKSTKMHFVAHSMGGLLARAYIQSHPHICVGNSVFIGTPHHGSKLANIVQSLPVVSNIFKPLKALTTHRTTALFVNKAFKLGIIAGNKNEGLLAAIFMPKQSDGRVTIASTKTDDSDDFILLPYGHNSIHHRQDTFEHIVHFLEHGRFDKD
jgi:triacylglycerol esterase/lipase EstA (alpha/beta hydrolase family)